MKRAILIICMLIVILNGYTQVTIGSNAEPNSNAVLDLISNSNKGLLLPRIALVSTTTASPMSAHVVGMTVYNTATVGDVSPGYYYNDGSKWIRIANAATEPWYNMATSTAATANTQDIYQTGKVSIGKNATGGLFSIYDTSGSINGTPLYLQFLSNSNSSVNPWFGFKSNLGNGSFSSLSVAGDMGFIFSTDADGSTYSRNGLVLAPHVAGGGGTPHGLKITEQGMISFNAQYPTETFDLSGGTMRIRQLPADGATNAIYTTPGGATTVPAITDVSGLAKTQTFTATRTVVADNNGVLGYVTGTPALLEPWYNTVTNKGSVANTDSVYVMGKVGIGTSTPAQMLHVNSNGYTQVRVTSGGSFNSEIYLGPSSGNAYKILSSGTGDLAGANKFAIYDVAAGLKRLIIDSNGNIGMNTNITTLSSKLTVNGDTYNPLQLKGLQPTSTTTDSVVMVDGKGVLKYKSATSLSAINEPWYNVATNSGATSLTQNIFHNNSVGINTTTTTASLLVKRGSHGSIFKVINGNDNEIIDFAESAGGTPALRLGDTDEAYNNTIIDLNDANKDIRINANNAVKLGDPNNTGNSTVLTIDDAGSKFIFVKGNVGIGVTGPKKVLHVDAKSDSLRIDNLAGAGALLGMDAKNNVYKLNGQTVSTSTLILNATGGSNMVYVTHWTDNVITNLPLTKVTDTDGGYNTTTGRYTVQKAGLYQVISNIALNNNPTPGNAFDGTFGQFYSHLLLDKGGAGTSKVDLDPKCTMVLRGAGIAGGITIYNNSGSALVFLNVGDVIYPNFLTYGTGGMNATTTSLLISRTNSYFRIYRVL